MITNNLIGLRPDIHVALDLIWFVDDLESKRRKGDAARRPINKKTKQMKIKIYYER